MCSYEWAGWLGSRDLGKLAGNFAIWTLHPLSPPFFFFFAGYNADVRRCSFFVLGLPVLSLLRNCWLLNWLAGYISRWKNMYCNNDPNEMVICPYNDAHCISAKKFPYHLPKCRKVGYENMAASRSNDLERVVSINSNNTNAFFRLHRV